MNKRSQQQAQQSQSGPSRFSISSHTAKSSTHQVDNSLFSQSSVSMGRRQQQIFLRLEKITCSISGHLLYVLCCLVLEIILFRPVQVHLKHFSHCVIQLFGHIGKLRRCQRATVCPNNFLRILINNCVYTPVRTQKVFFCYLFLFLSRLKDVTLGH